VIALPPIGYDFQPVFIRISTVNAHAEGVYDVRFECARCKYGVWARARGKGEGSDTALVVRASDRAAALNADVAARHDAERLVYASPCPRCGKHNPKVVKWAKAERKKAARRHVMRLLSTGAATAGAVVFIPVMMYAGITAFVGGKGNDDSILAVGAVVFSALAGYMPLAMWRELKPVPPQWSVFKRTPKQVEFLKDDPYRGAQPLAER
jgi:hypothetical protein